MSGTELRHRAGDGMSLRFLVPEAVWRYVVENDLYAS
jgi:nicotinic acid mononucleotide adenylyltransferase